MVAAKDVLSAGPVTLTLAVVIVLSESKDNLLFFPHLKVYHMNSIVHRLYIAQMQKWVCVVGI